MKTQSRQRIFAVLMLAAGLLIVLIGWETDWGRGFQGVVTPAAAPSSTEVPLALLRDFAPPGGAEAYAETTARPLLTPTRQPAPAAPAQEARPSMPRGQFVLMGTLLAGGKNFALLREASGSKQTRVAQGDTIKNLVVDKVEPTQVVLRLGEETEVLPLKTYIPVRAATSAGAGGRPPGHPPAARSPALAPAPVSSAPPRPQAKVISAPPRPETPVSSAPPRPQAPVTENTPADGRALRPGEVPGAAPGERRPVLVDRPRRARE